MTACSLALACAAFAQQPAVSPEVPLLVRAMRQALDDRVPEYVCTETLERFTRPRGAGALKQQERATAQRAFPGGDERHLRIIFNDATQLRYTGTETIAGRSTARFDFKAPPFPTPMRVSASGKTVETGSRGSFWVDWETCDVVLVEMHADGIPAEIEVASAVDRITYARIRQALLPAAAETEMTARTGHTSRTFSTFADCRTRK